MGPLAEPWDQGCSKAADRQLQGLAAPCGRSHLDYPTSGAARINAQPLNIPLLCCTAFPLVSKAHD